MEDKDNLEVGSKKMKKVCEKIGLRFLREWFDYWIQKGKIEKGNVKDYYKCIKVLEECDFSNINDDLI